MEYNSDIKIYESFDEMDLKINIIKGIYAYGFEKPSLIQQKGIKAVTSGKDVLAQAQSGTGKTGTFSIGVLERIDEELNNTQAIILAPTRELAKQIFKVINNLGNFTKIVIKDAIGGHRYDRNNYNVQNPHIIVGTPGRVLDDIMKNKINIHHLKILVLDEADEMLSRGFQEQIQKILYEIPENTQLCLFSATMSEMTLEITKKFMNDPIKILINAGELTLEGIRQYYITLDEENQKFEVLCDLYNTIAVTQSIIYCNSRKKVKYLSDKLRFNDFTVDCIFGDMHQEDRNKVMDNFRTGNTRVLITTDILARGIDVQQVSLVINYDIPNEVATYLHRIGRSGRFGRKGVTINLVIPYDVEQLRNIEKYYSTSVEEMPKNIAEFL